MGSGTLSGIVVCEHSSLCHPQKQVKALQWKEEDVCEEDPEILPPSLDPKLIQNKTEEK